MSQQTNVADLLKNIDMDALVRIMKPSATPDGARQLAAERLARAQLDGHHLRAAERHVDAPRPAQFPLHARVADMHHRALNAAAEPFSLCLRAAARLQRQICPVRFHVFLRPVSCSACILAGDAVKYKHPTRHFAA